MKKYLYILIVMLCTLSACTDSKEIDIVQQKDVKFNVNVAGVYESWGIDDFKNFLGNNKSNSVGIFTFIYDKSGNLVQKIVSTSKTIQTVAQSVGKLKAGDYEVITLVTMINDDDKASSVWKFVDEEKLNTLMITFNEGWSIAYWYQAFGLSTTSIKVGENTEVSISPKPVGSIIDVEYNNFWTSDYIYFSFSSRNNAEGLRLAPNLSETDRYYRGEYDKSNLWNSIGSFYSNGEALVDENSISYYTFETGNRPYLFGATKRQASDGKFTFDVTTKGDFDFEDGKLYVAYAYYVGQPDYLKTYLGSLSDFNSWYTNNIPVFAQPCTSWGGSVSIVKSYMNNYKLYQDITLGDNGYYYLLYYGKYRENYIEYDFDTETSGLETIYMAVYNYYASDKDIYNQLIKLGYQDEGYIDGDENSIGYQLFSNSTTLVGVFVGLIDEDGDRYTIMQFVKNDGNQTRASAIPQNIAKYKQIMSCPSKNCLTKTLSHF